MTPPARPADEYKVIRKGYRPRRFRPAARVRAAGLHRLLAAENGLPRGLPSTTANGGTSHRPRSRCHAEAKFPDAEFSIHMR